MTTRSETDTNGGPWGGRAVRQRRGVPVSPVSASGWSGALSSSCQRLFPMTHHVECVAILEPVKKDA